MNPVEQSIEIGSDTVELARVREFVRDGIVAGSFPVDLANQVILAVDEAVVNVIAHAFDDSSDKVGRIRICQTIDPQRCRIVIDDDGMVDFDPQAILGDAEPDMERHVGDGRHSGLGMFIIRSIMDVVEYDQAADDGFRHRLRMERFAHR
jgi:serine/threonine-protein kinase RsbW